MQQYSNNTINRMLIFIWLIFINVVANICTYFAEHSRQLLNLSSHQYHTIHVCILRLAMKS